MSSYNYNVHGVVVVSKNNGIINLQLYGGDLPLRGVVCDTRQSKSLHTMVLILSRAPDYSPHNLFSANPQNLTWPYTLDGVPPTLHLLLTQFGAQMAITVLTPSGYIITFLYTTMPDYLQWIKLTDSPVIMVSKYIFVSYAINNNIKSVLLLGNAC